MEPLTKCDHLFVFIYKENMRNMIISGESLKQGNLMRHFHRMSFDIYIKLVQYPNAETFIADILSINYLYK